MSASPMSATRDYGRRNLPVTAFIAVAIVWLLIVKLVGAATRDRADLHDGRLLTTHDVVWSLIIPIGAGTLFVYLVVTALGWWRPVLYDPRPVRPWVWWIPAIFAVAIAAGINYRGLADRGPTFTLTLLCAGMLVGFGEEGMFRAIGVTSLRRHGLSEGKVALWSSVIFGLAHVANIIGGDVRALGQALIVAFAGYFFYLIRRVSRSNILNSILHGLFDFTIITGTQAIAAGDKTYPGSAAAALLVYLICGVLLLIRRHKIEPTVSAAHATQ